MDGWIVRRMDGWIARRMDRWMDGLILDSECMNEGAEHISPKMIVSFSLNKLVCLRSLALSSRVTILSNLILILSLIS